MYIPLNDYEYLDLFPLIFVAVGLVGLVFAILAIVIGRNAKNGYKTLARVLAISTIFLFCGTVVNGIIGCRADSWKWRDQIDIYRHPCAWIAFGCGAGAFLFGLAAFLIQQFTKNIISLEKEEKVVKEVEFEKETNECLFYQEFSQGAIEIKDGYIAYYHNILPFTKCKKGRTTSIIFINDIQHISYKGCGWFNGALAFTFKHYNKPLVIRFSKWFVWRSKKLNPKMTPIYEYIKMQVINNNK